MHDLDDVTRLPDDFDGRVRLFPLPDLVLFPHAMQPLHIFEPRYAEMLTESLQTDRLIAMATLVDGSLAMHSSDPPIAPIVCIGRIVTHAALDNDRHNILLVGTKRATLINEIDAARPFRIAEVDVAHDVYPPLGAESRGTLKRELLKAFSEVIPSTATSKQNLYELLAGAMGLGPITDIISYSLPFTVSDKLKLLSLSDVDERAETLIGLLRSGKVNLNHVSEGESSGDQPESVVNEGFPPPFSMN